MRSAVGASGTQQRGNPCCGIALRYSVEALCCSEPIKRSAVRCECHARRRERLDWDSLLSFSDIGGSKSYICIKISYTKIQNKTTTAVVFTVSYTYNPESHLHIQKPYIYIYKSERGTYCDGPLLVCWPSCMRKIANILLCTYTD